MSWDDLCGKRTLMAIRTDVQHPFDANANGCALDLGDLTIFVFEAPDDGYRSAASEPMIVKTPLYSFGISPDYIRAPVLVSRWTQSEYGTATNGIELIDTRNGQTILFLGTDNTDSYYPCYTCDWRPQNLADNQKGS